MPTTTAALAAGQLRKLADALDTAPDDLPVSVYVNISPPYTYIGPKPTAEVDALAALFGLTAEPVKTGATWYYRATADRDGVDLNIDTYIDPPADRCACGVACTHTAGAR